MPASSVLLRDRSGAAAPSQGVKQEAPLRAMRCPTCRACQLRHIGPCDVHAAAADAIIAAMALRVVRDLRRTGRRSTDTPGTWSE